MNEAASRSWLVTTDRPRSDAPQDPGGAYHFEDTDRRVAKAHPTADSAHSSDVMFVATAPAEIEPARVVEEVVR
jgi:hypothetical protein